MTQMTTVTNELLAAWDLAWLLNPTQWMEGGDKCVFMYPLFKYNKLICKVVTLVFRILSYQLSNKLSLNNKQHPHKHHTLTTSHKAVPSAHKYSNIRFIGAKSRCSRLCIISTNGLTNKAVWSWPNEKHVKRK
jgi:hypothetical protein